MTSSHIFEGIGAIAQLAMTLSVSAGVWVAYKQLHAWRDQKHATMASDFALDLLVLVEEASEQLRWLRNAFDSIPKDKLTDRSYKYQVRLERYNEAATLFERLRKAQHKTNAVVDNAAISNNVDVLFEVRRKSALAIQALAERDPDDFESEDVETRKMYLRKRWDAYGSYERDHDPLGMEQLKAVDELRRLLKPLIMVKK